MATKEIHIVSQNPNPGRLSSRKKSKRQEWIKKCLRVLQHVSPTAAAKIIWKYSTTPNHRKFTDNQRRLLKEANTGHLVYKGCDLKTFKWGNGEKKVLLCHGWNSRTADFRKMIDTFVEAGFTVEGIDMKAHGLSEGKNSALPEFCEVLKDYYLTNGPYHALIGYSLGGLASGVITSELPDKLKPKQLFIIAAPPYVRYFFSDIVQKEVKCKPEVYEKMCDLVEEYYGLSIDYFDLRSKADALSLVEIHLIYDKDDKTVPFFRGEELREYYPKSTWISSEGMGHYNIISDEQIIALMTETILHKPITQENV